MKKPFEQIVAETIKRGREAANTATPPAGTAKRKTVVAAVTNHEPMPNEFTAKGGYINSILDARARGQATMDKIKKVFPPARSL